MSALKAGGHGAGQQRWGPRARGRAGAPRPRGMAAPSTITAALAGAGGGLGRHLVAALQKRRDGGRGSGCSVQVAGLPVASGPGPAGHGTRLCSAPCSGTLECCSGRYYSPYLRCHCRSAPCASTSWMRPRRPGCHAAAGGCPACRPPTIDLPSRFMLLLSCQDVVRQQHLALSPQMVLVLSPKAWACNLQAWVVAHLNASPCLPARCLAPQVPALPVLLRPAEDRVLQPLPQLPRGVRLRLPGGAAPPPGARGAAAEGGSGGARGGVRSSQGGTSSGGQAAWGAAAASPTCTSLAALATARPAHRAGADVAVPGRRGSSAAGAACTTAAAATAGAAGAVVAATAATTAARATATAARRIGGCAPCGVCPAARARCATPAGAHCRVA